METEAKDLHKSSTWPHYFDTGPKWTILYHDVTPYKIVFDSNMVAKLLDFQLSL